MTFEGHTVHFLGDLFDLVESMKEFNFSYPSLKETTGRRNHE